MKSEKILRPGEEIVIMERRDDNFMGRPVSRPVKYTVLIQYQHHVFAVSESGVHRSISNVELCENGILKNEAEQPDRKEYTRRHNEKM